MDDKKQQIKSNGRQKRFPAQMITRLWAQLLGNSPDAHVIFQRFVLTYIVDR
jgi:hypothetical protein